MFGSTLIALLAVQSADALPAPKLSAAPMILMSSTSEQAAPKKESKWNSKSCREMLFSSSRLGTVKVCKTRAEWRRFDDCHRSVTRYCTPEKKAERILSSWKADRIVCKDIKETGSRLSQQRVCSTAREWRLAEEEAQKALKDRQSMSTLTGGSEAVDVGRGGGPR